MAEASREAYQELNKRLEEINTSIKGAQKFARENDLLMGQYNIGVFSVKELKTEEFDASHDDDDDFIGSQTCW